VIVAALCLGLGGAWCATPGPVVPTQEGSVEIHAGEGWYQSRSERERDWDGVLHRRDPIDGPAARATLRFSLVTGEGELPIYAAGVAKKLEPYVDKHVAVRVERDGQIPGLHLRDTRLAGVSSVSWAGSSRQDWGWRHRLGRRRS